MSGNKNKAFAKPISLQALEQRYLLDAASIETLSDAVTNASVDNEINNALQQLPTYAAVPDKGQGDNHNPSEYLDVGPRLQKSEIVFIDTSVSNVGELISGINPAASVYFIDAESDLSLIHI